jgi:hypothetical protein
MRPASAARDATTPTDPAVGQVHSSAQILTFLPGLYAAELQVPAGLPKSGFSLPCARLDPVDPVARAGVVMTLSAGGWLSAAEPTLFLRVSDHAAHIMLTTYRGGQAPAPELRIRAIRSIGAVEIAPANPALAALTSETPDAASLTLLVHVENRGDIVVGPGAWGGAPRRDCALHGFAIQTRHALAAIELEYQAILGEDWQTPWFQGGEFCGNRSMSLPLRGVRLRLAGRSADHFACTYWGWFHDGTQTGPVSDGNACTAGGETLTAIRVEITRRPVPEMQVVHDHGRTHQRVAPSPVSSIKPASTPDLRERPRQNRIGASP